MKFLFILIGYCQLVMKMTGNIAVVMIAKHSYKSFHNSTWVVLFFFCINSPALFPITRQTRLVAVCCPTGVNPRDYDITSSLCRDRLRIKCLHINYGFPK